MTAPMPVASTDCETTGTDPTSHVAWEVAVVRRELDGTESRRLWQIRPNRAELFIADPKALEICRFEERFAVPNGADAADMTPTLTGGDPIPLDFLDAAQQMYDVLEGTVMVGSNPHFDASFLHQLFRVNKDPWHYRPVCAVTLAAGRLRALGAAWEMPFSTTDLSAAVGVPRPAPDVQHTAMADAVWALALYDAATAPVPALRHCVIPGCLREFDMIAQIEGRMPSRPSWSGDGWVSITTASPLHPGGGFICSDHADAFQTHHPVRMTTVALNRIDIRCACGKWSWTEDRWHGVARGLWEEHFLEQIGAFA